MFTVPGTGTVVKIYALPELPPLDPYPASDSKALIITTFPDIATELPKKSSVLVPYAFGLSSVCTRAPEVTLKIYALPERVPPASSSR